MTAPADSTGPHADVASLLARVRAGDRDAAGELFAGLQSELRLVARSVFRTQRPNQNAASVPQMHRALPPARMHMPVIERRRSQPSR